MDESSEVDDVDASLGVIVRDLILREKIIEPILFKKIHQDWEPCSWTLSDWGDLFKNEKLSMRYGQRTWDKSHPQWESECGKIDLTWKELQDWTKGEFTFLSKNGGPKDIWIYYDYKYLPDVFHLKSPAEKDFLKLIYFIENLKKKFCWNKLGFPERNGDHSTLWIGTNNANTNLHFDTYSCNLVCQVYGRKSWLLFPPKDVEFLQPTRVPYEESSVYSRINLSSPKGISPFIMDLQKCSPLKITLEPGDCLYLPPKWWHFVTSEEFSISVNTWIELPDDHGTRMEEAVLRCIVASVVNTTFPDTTTKVLNPNEMDLTEFNEADLNDMLQLSSTAFLLNQDGKPKSKLEDGSSDSDRILENVNATRRIAHSDKAQTDKDETKSSEPLRKRSRNSHSITLEELLSRSSIVEKLPPCTFESLQEANASSSIQEKDNEADTIDNSIKTHIKKSEVDEDDDADDQRPSYLEHLINAIGHPTVLKEISRQFLKNVNQRDK